MAHTSNVHRLIGAEFDKLKRANREHLVLDEVVRFKFPSTMPLDPAHLGVLFVLDENRDGRFSLEELRSIADLVASRERLYRPHELQAQFQGWCTLKLWQWAATVAGRDEVEQWFCKVLVETAEVPSFAEQPGVAFLGRDAIQLLYEILSVHQRHGLDFQAFFDLLQRVGEEKGTMDLLDEVLDDVVPLDVVKLLLRQILTGFSNAMPQLGFDPNLVDA